MSDTKSAGKAVAQQCPTFSAAAQKTVAVAFELVGGTVASSPQLAAKILEDKGVQDAIGKALKEVADGMLKDQQNGKSIAADAAMQRLRESMTKTVEKPLTDAAKKAVEAMPQYQRLQMSLKQFGCAFDKTPVGAFIDKNGTWLIVIGAVGAIAGGVGMYFAKAGDVPAEAFSLLPKLKPIKLGAISVSATKLDFKPSERRIDVDLTATGGWKKVEAKLELGASFANDEITGARGKGELTLKLDPEVVAMAKAYGVWKLGETGKPTTYSAGGSIGVTWKLSERVDLGFTLYGSHETAEANRSNKGGGTLDLTLKRPFGRGTNLKLNGGPSIGQTHPRMPDGGFGPAMPDKRVFFNLTLEFGGDGKKK